MNIFILILSFSLTLGTSNYTGNTASGPITTATGEHFHGKVVDLETGVPVSHAEITLIELKKKTYSNDQGVFEFQNLPSGRHTLGVHATLYAAQHFSIEVPQKMDFLVKLNYDAHFEEEITVTAAPWAIKPLNTPQTVSIISNKDISLSASSLGEGLDEIPGVDQVGSGDALGTPVIRGVSENRIKILNDGVGLNHQQFSFRHSPNLEVAFAEKIEVVKGPLSVLHGPDAMGGVINVISAPLPTAFDGKPSLNGNIKTSYESNSSRKSIQAGLQGAVGGFGWRIGVLERKSGNTETPEQVLENTQFEQTNGELHLGYAGEWGSIKLKASHWENETGYYRPEDFLLTLDDDFISLEGWHPLGKSEISWVAGHQVNRRKAYPVELNGAPAVDLKLETQSGKLTWRQPRFETDQLKLNGTFALEYSEMENTPYAKKKLLPAYNNKSWAVVAFQELNIGGSGAHGWVLSSGLRLDTQDLFVPEDSSRELDEAFDETYHTVTGTAGFVYKLTSHLSWAGTLGRGWRAPTAFELFANGIHGGVSAVQLGNRFLTEETNFNYETALRMLNTHFSGSITAYETRYSDYIYLRDSGEIQNDLPVFVYEQGDVSMRGLELEGEWFPKEYLQLGLTYNALYSNNDETGSRLPQTPANKGRARIRLHTQRIKSLQHPYLGLELELVGRGYVSGPDEPFGTPTDSYSLIRLNTGFAWKNHRKQEFSFRFQVNNLLDETYRDFLYPYKSWAANPGRNLVASLGYRF